MFNPASGSACGILNSLCVSMQRIFVHRWVIVPTHSSSSYFDSGQKHLKEDLLFFCLGLNSTKKKLSIIYISE